MARSRQGITSPTCGTGSPGEVRGRETMKNYVDHVGAPYCETLSRLAHWRVDESAAGFTVVQLYPSVFWIPISTFDTPPSPLSVF